MNKTYRLICFILNKYFRLFYSVQIKGLEHMNPEDNYVICANHPSALDPFLLASMLPSPISFMAKKELFKNKIFAAFLDHVGVFPVDREKNDLRSIKRAMKTLKSGMHLGLFPEGTRSHKLQNQSIKSGVALIAYKTEKPILPITIQSTYKKFSSIDIVIHQPVVIESHGEAKISQDELQAHALDVMKKIYSIIK